MKPLILIRHAEAEHHIEDITGGWTDSTLTERGVYQASLLADRLSRELSGVPLFLGCSNLRRAMQTAEIIGGSLGVQPQIFPQLADLNNGIAAGKTHSEAKKFAIRPTEPILDWQPYPDAESWRQFFERVSDFLDDFTGRQASPAILVTHAAAIHVIVAWWLQLAVESHTHFGIAPASITVLTLNQWNERTVERLNDTAHLYAAGMVDEIRLELDQRN